MNKKIKLLSVILLISFSCKNNVSEEDASVQKIAESTNAESSTTATAEQYHTSGDNNILGVIDEYDGKPINKHPTDTDMIIKDKIALITYKSRLIDMGDFYKLRLNDKKLKQGMNICDKDEILRKYYDFPYINGCLSGFAINDSMIVTVGHLDIPSNDIAIIYGYFGYKNEYIINKRDVSYVKRIATNYDETIKASDYAILRTTETIDPNHIVDLHNKNSSLDLKSAKYIVAGYPFGIPLVWEPNIRINSYKVNFYTMNADILKGNSGGPLFYISHGKMYVVGIVLDSFLDYKSAGGTCISIISKPIEQLPENMLPLSLNFNTININL